MPSILEDARIGRAAGSRSPLPYTRQSSPSAYSSSSSSSDYEEKSPFLPVSNSSFSNTIIEDDCMVITTSDNASLDPMYRRPWRQFVSRFFFITAIIPCILAMWSLGIQVRILTYSDLMADFHILKRLFVYLFMSIDVVWTGTALGSMHVQRNSG